MNPATIVPFAVVDGGLSTALELLGHRPGGLLWTAQLVIDRPDAVVAAHRSFVDAGADVIISSSYQASVAGFVHAGASRSEAVLALASTTELARRSGASIVAASIGPYGATLGDGSEYHGNYDASWHDVRLFHRERLAVLCDTAPDLLAIETIPGRIEAEIVLDEVQRLNGPPAWLSVTCRDDSSTCAGDPIGSVAALGDQAAGVIAVGVNCTDPRFVATLLEAARTATAKPLVAYPNHGRAWDPVAKCWTGAGDHGGQRVDDWYRAGARFIGGCCGVGPAGVAEVFAGRAALASEA